MRNVSNCNRCAHIWLQRESTIRTKECPKCHSPYWDKERKNKRRIIR